MEHTPRGLCRHRSEVYRPRSVKLRQIPCHRSLARGSSTYLPRSVPLISRAFHLAPTGSTLRAAPPSIRRLSHASHGSTRFFLCEDEAGAKAGFSKERLILTSKK